MSFSSNTKRELCESAARKCCRKAECYGLFLFGRSFSPAAVSLTTENLAVGRRAAELAAEATGAIMDVSSVKIRKKNAAASYTVSAAGPGQAKKLFAALGHSAEEISLRINLANLENECCRAAFLRGAFLACGTVASPERDYRLEFAVPHMNLAAGLATLIGDAPELRLEPRVSRRRGAFVVYMKGGEHVADFLTLLGASDAAMELMQVRMLKEVRNKVNRRTNFETANIGKAASAAAHEVVAIERIRARGKGDALQEDLRELAALRMRYPELSLGELGQRLTPPLSRSGVHHRMRRILEFAEKLKEEQR